MHKKVKPNGLQKLNKEQQKLIIYADTAILTTQSTKNMIQFIAKIYLNYIVSFPIPKNNLYIQNVMSAIAHISFKK